MKVYVKVSLEFVNISVTYTVVIESWAKFCIFITISHAKNNFVNILRKLEKELFSQLQYNIEVFCAGRTALFKEKYNYLQ